MRTTPKILETGCTRCNRRSGRDGVMKHPGLRLNGSAHGCSQTTGKGGSIVKTLVLMMKG